MTAAIIMQAGNEPVYGNFETGCVSDNPSSADSGYLRQCI